MIGTTFIFSLQDGISRHLAESYNTLMIVMIRYWVFALFVCALAARQTGGLRATARTRQSILQITRGVLLAAEVCVAVYAFTRLGLVATHAVFACYPLLVAALSGPILGEAVGWRRWIAIGTGFIGVLIILRPGSDLMQIEALIAFASAVIFALYALLTRYAARQDSAMTSFFWTGIAGAVAMSLVGLPLWEPMAAVDWIWMALLCCTAVTGHWMLIRCYEVAEASSVQPFAYLQLVFASGVGVLFFADTISWNIALGATIVVSAGLFTFYRARKLSAQSVPR